MILLIVPLLLIALQGVFAASETALMSIENVKILRAKEENKRWALRASKFLERPERFFSTILICENFILVVASTLFAKFFVEHFGDHGTILSTILLSLFSLVIGLFVPKSIALSYPMSVMTHLSDVIYYIEIITYPFISFFATVAKGLAYLFRSTSRATIRRQDIVYAMGEYEKKASMLAARLFNFSKTTVGDIMIPLEAVFSCAKGRELETLSTRHKRIYTRIPIYEGEPHNIVGTFNIKDYFYRNNVMLRVPFFVHVTDRCMSIFQVMKHKGEHMAIVRDAHGTVIGIVTLEDLIEELVGEIRDEK